MSIQKSKERNHVNQAKGLLQKWWGDPTSFVKVPASGALRWKGTSYWIFSDMVPPQDFPFCVECKHHAEINVEDVLRKGWQHAKISWYFYSQVVKDAIRATETLGENIYPMMIYRENRNVNNVVLQSNLFFKLPADVLNSFSYITVYIPGQSPAFVIADAGKFFEKVPREVFERYILEREPAPVSLAS